MVRAILKISLLALPMFLTGTSLAQVPPHYPGTICFTPQFWCWLPRPLYPGSSCVCPTQYGPVFGVVG